MLDAYVQSERPEVLLQAVFYQDEAPPHTIHTVRSHWDEMSPNSCIARYGQTG